MTHSRVFPLTLSPNSTLSIELGTYNEGTKMIPGSEQAVAEKASKTARNVNTPNAKTAELLHCDATFTRKNIVGMIMREYVQSIHGHSGPTKQWNGNRESFTPKSNQLLPIRWGLSTNFASKWRSLPAANLPMFRVTSPTPECPGNSPPMLEF